MESLTRRRFNIMVVSVLLLYPWNDVYAQAKPAVQAITVYKTPT